MEHRSVTGFPGEKLRDALWEPYRRRLEAGEKSDRILVLVESNTRTAWNERLKSLPFPSGAQRVFTPDAWIRREIEEWWPLLERHLAPFPSSQRQPLFLAVDLAQYVMATFTRANRLEGLLESARTPLSLQNGQMLDALARSVENGASLFTGLDREAPRRLALEIAGRLKLGAPPNAHALLAEVGTAIEQYLEGMLGLRALDHALALDLFASILWNDPSYRACFLEKTSSLLIENLDETSPRLQRIFQQAMELGVSHFSTLQSDPGDHGDDKIVENIGNFRGGLKEYLGADPEGGWAIAPSPSILSEPEPPFAELGRALHRSLQTEEYPGVLPDHPPIPRDRIRISIDSVAYPDMLDLVARDLGLLLANGIRPAEIAMVAPALDPLLIWSLRGRLERQNVPLYVFAGTNRLNDYRPVRLLLALAKLCHPAWKVPPSRFELIELLEFATRINPLQLGRLSGTLFPENRLAETGGDILRLQGLPNSASRYDTLCRWLQKDRPEPSTLSRFFREAFAEVYAPLGGRNTRQARELSQIGQLIELGDRFEQLSERLFDTGDGRRFLSFLQDNPIAERPFFKREQHQDAVMLSTPNQLAEKGFLEERLRHLFLLDFGSERWWKSDRRELNNPRVFAKAREHASEHYSIDEEERDMGEKLARTLLTCLLKPTEGVWIYASLSDSEGRENRGELPTLLEAAFNKRKAGS